MNKSGIETIIFLARSIRIKGFDMMNCICPARDTVDAGADWTNIEVNIELTLKTVIAINIMLKIMLYFLYLLSLNGNTKVKKPSNMYGGLIKLINKIDMKNIARFFSLISPQYILTK